MDSVNLFVDSAANHSIYLLKEIDNVDDETYVPDYLNQDLVEGYFQQRYELLLKRREEAAIHHVSNGHCNNQQF